MACGFSMFKSYSSKGRLRLEELGQYYRDYVALMAHFDAVLPGRVVAQIGVLDEPVQRARSHAVRAVDQGGVTEIDKFGGVAGAKQGMVDDHVRLLTSGR